MLCPIGAITEIVTHISAAAISSSSHQQQQPSAAFVLHMQ
jgi:hypothetical protein